VADKENKLQLTNDDRFTALFEQSPLSIQVFSPDGRTIRVNKAWEKLWGVTLDQIPEYNILEDQQLVEKGVMPFIKRGFEGEIVQTPSLLYDPEETIPDKTRNEEPKRWTKAIIYPLKDNEGRVQEVVLIHEDITLRKNIEEESARLTKQIENQRKALQELVSNVPGVVWEAWGEPDEKNQRINFVSDYVEEMLGYSVEEWLSIPNFWLEIVHEEDKKQAAADASKKFVSLKGGSSRFRWVAKDGTALWVEARSTVITDEAGNPVGMRGVTMDVTERKKKEESERFLYEASSALASSLDYETTLRTVALLSVPHFADWCAVDVLDENGSLNRLAVAHIDPDKILWAEEINAKYPADQNAPHGLYNVLRTGQSEFYPEIPDEMLALGAKDEEHLNLMRQIGFRSVMLVPLKTRENILGVITFVNSDSKNHTAEDLALAEDLANRAALAIDNARLFRAEQNTRKAAERTSDLLKRLQSVSTSLSHALTPKEVAKAVIAQGINSSGAYAGVVLLFDEKSGELKIVETAGFPKEVSDNWQKFNIDQKVPIVDSIRRRAPVFIESVDLYQNEYPLLGPLVSVTGSKSLAAIPLIAEGKTIGALGLSFKTQQNFNEDDRAFLQALAQQCAQALERARLYENERRLRSEAEAANRIKDEFLATVSHELRTPLNAIVGWSSLLKTKRLEPEMAEQAIETIERNAKSQAQIIEDLLDVSRIITGKIKLDISLINLDSVISAAVEGLRPSADAKGITISTTIDYEAAYVHADPERLQQILWNLLSNAVKFTSKNGRIEVKLERVESFAQISVTDNGIGINPEFLPFVFDRFRQADGTTTRMHSGLGLGLSIVRYLVEMHGGTVQAKSEGLNKGAAFIVSLPIASVINYKTAQENQNEFPAENNNSLKGLRVLVVDDERDSLFLLKTIIENYGGAAKAAKSVAEALEVFGEFDPHILVSDIGMPEEDGYSLIQKLRSLPIQSDIPAIALTAYAGENDRKRALESGFQVHIAKPVDFSELIAAIEELNNNQSFN